MHILINSYILYLQRMYMCAYMQPKYQRNTEDCSKMVFHSNTVLELNTQNLEC